MLATTVVGIALVLKKEIRWLLERLAEFEGPGGLRAKFFPFGEATVDQQGKGIQDDDQTGEEKVEVADDSAIRPHSKSVQPPSSEFPQRTATSNTGDWCKYQNLYWLGHDLMWTVDMLLRAAEKPKIVHGLEYSLGHASKLGLDQTPAGVRLRRLTDEARASFDSDWVGAKRNAVAIELRSVIKEIGDLAGVAQRQSESASG